MSTTQASEAARALAHQRWGSTVVSRAVQVVRERSAELSEDQRAVLRQVAGGERDGDDAR